MARRSAQEIQALERAYQLESRSFIRYLEEAGQPLVRSEWDREGRARLEAWYVETRGQLGALLRLLEQEGATPGPSSWPLTFSECNFLEMPYVLRAVPPRLESHLAALEAESAALKGWPEAAAALRDLIASHRAQLKALSAFATSAPKAPAAPERRQTSANWW